MTLIATATATTSAPPAAVFARWADVGTWSDWNSDTEWVRLDGSFEQGATGKLKPKGGPAVRFEITRLTDTEFVDVSKLFGARLTFAHTVAETAAGTVINVRIELDGPLRWLWTKVLGADLAKSIQPDMAGLIAAAESVPV